MGGGEELGVGLAHACFPCTCRVHVRFSGTEIFPSASYTCTPVFVSGMALREVVILNIFLEKLLLFLLKRTAILFIATCRV